jgi:DNA repair exonuclease SbcCD ATPase subunit
MWKDLLESETARREQADEDNKQLREEIARLRSDGSSTTTNNHNSNVYHVTKRPHKSSADLHSSESDRAVNRKGVTSAASSHTLVENLRHENAELRREVAAQTSMLTSRNKERERLYQDVEELKLQRRGDGLRSVAGDSILERSASRAHNRPTSGESEGTRFTQLSDAERDRYEAKIGELRDQVSELKLKNQEVSRKVKDGLVELAEAKTAIADYEAMTTKLDEELDQAAHECSATENERDQALQANEELEAEFEDLKAEAQQTIDELELELESRIAKLQKSEEEHNAVQEDVRMLREGLRLIEDEAAKNGKRVQDLQMELEDTNREMESMENRLYEEKSKGERLAVQQESSQSEIAFLREEQDGDKIKIGDLESALKSAQTSLEDEKARVKELDERLAEERQQREVVAGKEKQEVQKVINDLNREVSGAKEEARKLKKSLQSREQEATTWKERLMELENSLREALGDLNGTRSSLLKVRS